MCEIIFSNKEIENLIQTALKEAVVGHLRLIPQKYKNFFNIIVKMREDKVD